MSETSPTRSTPPPSYRLILTLAGIAMMSGLFVATTFQVTRERIAENRAEALQKAILKVLPEATSRRNFILDESGLQELDASSAAKPTLFAGYNDAGELTGVAMEASARGYQDVVKILYGYAPEFECITGFTVLQSSETPGLGDRVETDAEFLQNFECLDASLNAEGTDLANKIVTVKHGDKTDPWQIDAISGATVTSAAIGSALQSSASEVLPDLKPHLDKLQQPPATEVTTAP